LIVLKNYAIKAKKLLFTIKGKKKMKFLSILMILIITGGFAFLATWDIPQPVNQVEKTVPNETFFETK